MDSQLSSWKKGFTLVELLVALAVMAILISVTAPSFENFVRRTNTDAAATDLFNALHFARAEAVRLGDPVSLRSKSSTADNEWGEGWCIAAQPLAQCGGTVIRDYGPAASNVKTDAAGGKQLITFSRHGSLSSAVETFHICQGSSKGVEITLMASGVARRTSYNCP